MKCRKQLKYHKIPISNLWEVRLDGDIWQRVKRVANARGCTYSWIVRYCVFRLARKTHIVMRPAMENLSREIKRHYRYTQKLHRHMLCLYGEDEMLIRLAAMKLSVTLSHFIRLSLYWFLSKVECYKVTWSEIFYHGTKICRYFDYSRKNTYKFPYYETIFYVKWPKQAWFRHARPNVSMVFTPDFHYKKSINHF